MEKKKHFFKRVNAKKKLIINNLKATKASTFKRFEKKQKYWNKMFCLM